MYSLEKLEELSAIAEKHGTFDSVANYLGISPNKLLEQRIKNIELDKFLKKAVKKYKTDTCFAEDYEFSTEELEDIAKLVREHNVDYAAKRYGVRADKLFRMRHNNELLESAIKKGQEQRKSDSMFNQALSMFRKLDEECLNNITDIALDGGIEAVEKYYKVSPYILRICRKELPKLDSAIKKALKQRPRKSVTSGIKAKITETNFKKKEEKVSKIYNEKGTTRKPPKEIIDKTMKGIRDQTDNALANFRKLMHERKKLEYRERFLNGEFEDMI
mgnify:CR=1 FL=1